MKVILVLMAFSSHENQMRDALAFDMLPPRRHGTLRSLLEIILQMCQTSLCAMDTG